jgi:hypothetical protein
VQCIQSRCLKHVRYVVEQEKPCSIFEILLMVVKYWWVEGVRGARNPLSWLRMGTHVVWPPVSAMIFGQIFFALVGRILQVYLSHLQSCT